VIVAVNLFKVWLLRERLGFLFDEPDKLRLALRRSGSRENQGNAHHEEALQPPQERERERSFGRAK